MASIYIIAHSLADGWAGPCKIGMSHDCKNRLQSLRSGNPRPIGLYAAINTGSRPNAAQAETVLHQFFSPERLAGEWFNIEPEAALSAARVFVCGMIKKAAEELGFDVEPLDVLDSLTTRPETL